MRWAYANDTNMHILDEDGSARAVNSEDQLVVLHKFTLAQLKSAFARFEAELRTELSDALSKTPEEFADWNRVEKYRIEEHFCRKNACIAFKRLSVHSNRLSWIHQPPLVRALIDLGHVPALTPHGRPRKNLPRGDGGAPEVAQSLSLVHQKEVIKAILENREYDLDEIVVLPSQRDAIGIKHVRHFLDSARTVDSAWDALCDELRSFSNEQISRPTKGEKSGRGTGRRFATPWFLAYLAREQAVIWPWSASGNAHNILPRMLAPWLWAFFTPPEGRGLASTILDSANTTERESIPPIFRKLMLSTNFFEDTTTFRAEHLVFLKAMRESSRTIQTHRDHAVNAIFKGILAYHNLTHEDVGAVSSYFGGGRRLSSRHGQDAFSWIDIPNPASKKIYEQVLGDSMPESFPSYVRNWAQDLRTLLPLWGVESIRGKVDDLGFWLLWLIHVGDKLAPKVWTDINRERHINSLGHGSNLTFVDFVSLKANRQNAKRIISTLRQAWLLAATRDGFAGKAPCPIDVHFDVPRKEKPKTSPLGRTRRKALDPTILQLLIEENRRSDSEGNSFAFARSLDRFNRDVTDTTTGLRKEVFWPALPTLLDAIMTMGMRKGMAQWMDSGEGDENWIDVGRKVEIPNPLQTATPGRKMGFLQLISLDTSTRVVGANFPINKSGEYDVPWADPETAQLILAMRDWQVRFFPRQKPVLSSRDSLTEKYADLTAIPHVFPLFRDPLSKYKALPPTDETIYRYWTDLLKHCEPILNNRQRQRAAALDRPYVEQPLLIRQKPRWDIHSLRVTAVTTLVEAGVSPEIVAQLVGHKSVAMTWHYVAIDTGKTHHAIQEGMERRRLNAIADISKIKDSDDVEAKIEQILGGVVTQRAHHGVGRAFLKSTIESGEPDGYEVYSHGICPGGDCSTGGEMFRNSFQAVFRPRACSRCRFRVTGPAFLNGLVHRLNSLMVELCTTYETETGLNNKIEQAEDEGGPAIILEALVNRQRDLRDNLWAEWCAELKTIQLSKALLEKSSRNATLPTIVGLDAGSFRAKLKTVHQLSLLQEVLDDENIITGASIEVPPETRLKRDEMLLEIARQNDASQFFYQLPPDTRKRALDAFGALLTHQVSETDGDTAVHNIDALLNGSERSSVIAEAARGIAAQESSTERRNGEGVIGREHA